MMKLAMAQMAMSKDMEANFQKSYDFVRQAAGADLIFFPEVQHMPFLPQYEAAELPEKLGKKRDDYLLWPDDAHVTAFNELARQSQCMVAPNLYLQYGGKAYDTSLFIDKDGRLLGKSTMVHVVSAPQFYELDYYTPSEDGFRVYDTACGKIGIVICFDRHLPESIRTCAAMGAQLVLIPTANLTTEPLQLFEWEIRVQAYQNNVFVAMCNRVGREGDVNFAGQSLVVDSEGQTLLKGDDKEALLTCDLDLSQCRQSRSSRSYITLRRPEMYR
uniref:carbon-nitrogen hydrolase family protein n=1 Tax=Megasphaera elsdenii TaxID=907 RepID=UPI003FF11465